MLEIWRYESMNLNRKDDKKYVEIFRKQNVDFYQLQMFYRPMGY